MNISDFTRRPNAVISTLKRIGQKTVTTTGCKIYVPSRFRDKHLTTIANEIYIVGIFMIVVDDKYYAVNKVCSMMRIEPSSMNTVMFEGREYLEFIFEKGDTVIANNNLVRDGKLLYYIFDEIPARGNIPVFLNYEDLITLFNTADEFSGVNLSSTPTILHMLLSKVGRNAKNLNEYFRQVSTGKDLDEVVFIPLRSNTHGATNTTARLMGSYFSDNITGALVNQSDRVENIEQILLN